MPIKIEMQKVHKREKMSHMKGVSCRVNTGVGGHGGGFNEFI